MASTFGAVLQGVTGQRVEVQASAIQGRAETWARAVKVTGKAHREVQEVVQRLSGALTALGLSKPSRAIVINLAPASVDKVGTSLDLPIAAAILDAAGLLDWSKAASRHVMLGELGLDGTIRAVQGALSLASTANPGDTVIVPRANVQEISLLNAGGKRLKLLIADTLGELLAYGQHRGTLGQYKPEKIKAVRAYGTPPDFKHIKGQKKARRAAEIAAAGSHSVLYIGQQGVGKSLIAHAIAGIMPKMTVPEILEVTQIYSAAGLLEDGKAALSRPFRLVHHTASAQSVVGGGRGKIVPGEISLAHLGILCLDELPEFNRAVLEALRQPMDSGTVHIARVGAVAALPCRFQLIATANPCPCGMKGQGECVRCKSKGKENTPCDCGGVRSSLCRCSDTKADKYTAKMSGPLLDRIDMTIEMSGLTTGEMMEDEQESTESIQRKVDRAVRIQQARYKGTGIGCNAQIPFGELDRLCVLEPRAKAIFQSHVSGLSGRRCDKLTKVARTIADLNGNEAIREDDMQEAADFVS